MRFYLKSRFTHVWPKIPFWIPKLKRYLYALTIYFSYPNYIFFLRPVHHFPFLMVSARNKDQNVSESISSIRAELLKKNQETSFLLMHILKETKTPIWNQHSLILHYWYQYGYGVHHHETFFWLIFGHNFDITYQLHAFPKVKKLNCNFFT